MAMSASTLVTYPTQQVFETLVDKAFQEHTAELVGGSLQKFELSGDPQGACTVELVRSIPTNRLPDIARKVVGETLNVTQVERWSAPDALGSRTAEIEISVSGVPVSASAREVLVPEEGATRVQVEGEVKSSVPLLGPKIAKAAEPMVSKALNIQAEQASKWLAKESK
ncbi:DUF2505 domain-containing protein [Haematomicrobium sanguinis]|uniref:DUF2505 domain-containing protein n=1 Tax=Haematomicrobium sanguinis TaxID=479106 RepID=UPI000479111F|nr:DUF2505 domain-containing protein [Haematomicrobium sanguinis]